MFRGHDAFIIARLGVACQFRSRWLVFPIRGCAGWHGASDADGWQQVGQQCVGEGIRVGAQVAGRGRGEVVQAGGDVLVAALDDPVGERGDGFGARAGVGGGVQGRVEGLVEPGHAAVGVQVRGWGWPALE
ncbi:hypothetical protein ABH940_006164 [Streptacidiphilus sp. BW17]